MPCIVRQGKHRAAVATRKSWTEALNYTRIVTRKKEEQMPRWQKQTTGFISSVEDGELFAVDFILFDA